MKKIDPEKSKDYTSIDTMEEQEGKYKKCVFYNNTYVHIEVCKKKCKALMAHKKKQISASKIPNCASDRSLDEKYI